MTRTANAIGLAAAFGLSLAFGLFALALPIARPQDPLYGPGGQDVPDISEFPGLPGQGSEGTFPSLRPAKVLDGHREFVRGVAFSPDGKTLASSGEDVAILWDAHTGKVRHRLEPGGNDQAKAYSIAFSPDGKTVAVGGYVGDVFLFDPETGKLRAKLDEPSLAVLGLAYSPDGSILAASHDQAAVMLFDTKSNKLLATLKPPQGNIQRFGFSPDGKTLAAITGEALQFWDVASRQLKKSVDVESSEPLSGYSALAVSPTAPLAAASGGSPTKNQTRFWDLKSLQQRGGLVTGDFEPTIKALTFSPDGKLLASGTAGDAPERPGASLWSVASGQRLAHLLGSPEDVAQLAFSPDGRRVAAACLDKKVRIWEVSRAGSRAAGKGKASKAKARGKTRGKRSSR